MADKLSLMIKGCIYREPTLNRKVAIMAVVAIVVVIGGSLAFKWMLGGPGHVEDVVVQPLSANGAGLTGKRPAGSSLRPQGAPGQTQQPKRIQPSVSVRNPADAVSFNWTAYYALHCPEHHNGNPVRKRSPYTSSSAGGLYQARGSTGGTGLPNAATAPPRSPTQPKVADDQQKAVDDWAKARPTSAPAPGP
jgi:hypothetical protein